MLGKAAGYDPRMATSETLQTIALSPAEHDEVTALAVCREEFSICGRRVCLYATAPPLLDGFRQTYADFRCTADPGPADLTIRCHHREGPVPAITFTVRDRAYRTTDPGLVANPFPVLDHLLVTHFDSHYIIHAGCVGRADRAIVVSGASHMGKTTLTAFLVARGLTFLSDEIAPLSRDDGRVAPFPVDLGIRAGPAADLVEALPGTALDCGTDRKKLVKARHVSRAVARAPLPLHAVVFLTSRLSSEVATARRFDGLARVTFAAMTPAFRAAVLEATRSELLGEEPVCQGVFSLLVRSRDPAGFLDALRRTAEAAQVPIVFIEYEDLDPRDFSAEPRLMKLSPAIGVMELAKKIPSRQKAELVRTCFGGSMPGLIEELSALVRDVSFYKLSPGRLEPMLRTIETLP